MANNFYQPGEQRADRVNALFATIAPRYDLINDLQSFGLHRRWKRRLIKLAQPTPTDAALDVCCGTGDLSFALAPAVKSVTGLDFNAPMLAVAEQNRVRHPQTPVDKIKFIQGDAQKLPFPDSSFDIITVGYGLRNLSSWETGLTEMARVARPGARIISLDFGKPDNAAWRTLYFTYLRLVVPVFGLIFCRKPSAYSYILQSLKHYPAQHGVAAKMRTLGLANVRIHNLCGGAMTINYGEKPRGG